jgi:phage antirepressor YoqD-like protein
MDIEKAIQFLLEQQAKHESRQHEFDANISKLNEGLLQVHEMLLQTNAHLVQVAATQERTGEILATLAERQIETENALAALAAETKTLTSVLERHLADHERP